VPPPHTADALSRTLLDGTCIASTWQKVLAGRLGLTQSTMQCLPLESELVNAIQNKLSAIFLTHTRDDIHSDHNCKNRIISSYIQLLWNGQFGCHHPIYDIVGVPYDIYMDIVRFRTLNIPAMVYKVPRSNRALPYSRRFCPFGCKQPADLEHVMLHCRTTRLAIVGHQTTIASIFDSRDIDYLHDLAFTIHAIMEKLRQRTPDHKAIQSSSQTQHLTNTNRDAPIVDTTMEHDGQL
jgi:hypothetical protein